MSEMNAGGLRVVRGNKRAHLVQGNEYVHLPLDALVEGVCFEQRLLARDHARTRRHTTAFAHLQILPSDFFPARVSVPLPRIAHSRRIPPEVVARLQPVLQPSLVLPFYKKQTMGMPKQDK